MTGTTSKHKQMYCILPHAFKVQGMYRACPGWWNGSCGQIQGPRAKHGQASECDHTHDMTTWGPKFLAPAAKFVPSGQPICPKCHASPASIFKLCGISQRFHPCEIKTTILPELMTSMLAEMWSIYWQVSWSDSLAGVSLPEAEPVWQACIGMSQSRFTVPS